MLEERVSASARREKANKRRKTRRLGTSRLTMNITLTLVSLDHKEVSHMTPNVVLVASSVTTEDFLEAMQQSVSS